MWHEEHHTVSDRPSFGSKDLSVDYGSALETFKHLTHLKGRVESADNTLAGIGSSWVR